MQNSLPLAIFKKPFFKENGFFDIMLAFSYII